MGRWTVLTRPFNRMEDGKTYLTKGSKSAEAVKKKCVRREVGQVTCSLCKFPVNLLFVCK